MTKIRKPIKQGSFVKFYGYTSLGKHCYGEESGEQEYVRVTCDWDAEPGLVCTEIGEIERQQVNKVKRLVKSVRREFKVRWCHEFRDHDCISSLMYDVNPLCNQCDIIKVCEVKK